MAAVQPKYHIIGAGVAGLQAAQLIRRKYPQAEITVYEAAEHPGGRCFSFADPKLGITLDNATHAVLHGNRLAAAYLGQDAKFAKAVFYDMAAKRINAGQFANLKEKSLALFNLPPDRAAPGIIAKNARQAVSLYVRTAEGLVLPRRFERLPDQAVVQRA